MKAIRKKKEKKHVLSLIWTSWTRQKRITARSTQYVNTEDGCLSYLFVSVWICSNLAVRPAEPAAPARRAYVTRVGARSGRSLASLAYIHEHKCETVPKISDQVASCSRYDSWQKKKKHEKNRRHSSKGELERMTLSVRIIVKPNVIYIHALKII